jgi:hypothetical protein
LIVVPSVRETGIAGIREEAAFRTKIPTKGKWPILNCIALSTKIFFASQTFLQVLLLTIQLLKITEEGLQEAEGLGEEAKVSSFLWLSAFPLELIPLQMLQDHRDGDAKTLGASVFFPEKKARTSWRRSIKVSAITTRLHVRLSARLSDELSTGPHPGAMPMNLSEGAKGANTSSSNNTSRPTS